MRNPERKIGALSVGCLLVGLGLVLFVHYDAFCLFVPCDRPATLVVESAPGASTEGCSVHLGDPDFPELAREARRIPSRLRRRPASARRREPKLPQPPMSRTHLFR